MLKNITLSAEDVLIAQARRQAQAENTTLNELFRSWLAQYVARPAASESYRALMERLDHIHAGRKYSREELNERR